MSPFTQWLKDKGLTQASLAELAGVDHAQVSRYSAGRRPSATLRNYLMSVDVDMVQRQERFAAKQTRTNRTKAEAAA